MAEKEENLKMKASAIKEHIKQLEESINIKKQNA